jgi:4'-phosphopantetheinyl transferase
VAIMKISYDKTGQPLLCNPTQQISISHSLSLAAIIISDKPVGIDVEEITRNVEKVSARFLSPEELTWTANSHNSHLSRLICWCAKEAIYKLVKKSDVDFSNHIRIYPFSCESENDFRAAFVKGKETINLKLKYMIAENNVVVWSVGE